MTLYDYTEEYRELYDHLADAEDMDAWETELKALDSDFEQKIHYCASFVKEMEADAAALKVEEKRLADKRRVAENKANRLKESMLIAMKTAGRLKVKTSLFSVGVQKNPPAVVLSDEFDPETSLYATSKITWTANKKRIKEVIEAGEIVPGASIVRTEGVRIR